MERGIMADDIDKLAKWAKSQGWDVRVDADGYRRFYTPEGVYVVRYPSTPRNKRRRFLDVVTAVKKHGLPWPAPSKSEKRAQRGKESR